MRAALLVVPAVAAAMVLAADLAALGGPAATEPMGQRPSGQGELVWRSGSYLLRLTDRPCGVAEYRAELEEIGVPPARAFVATQAGRPTSAGCWAADIGGDILTRQPGEAPGVIAREWLTREIGI